MLVRSLFTIYNISLVRLIGDLLKTCQYQFWGLLFCLIVLLFWANNVGIRIVQLIGDRVQLQTRAPANTFPPHLELGECCCMSTAWTLTLSRCVDTFEHAGDLRSERPCVSCSAVTSAEKKNPSFYFVLHYLCLLKSSLSVLLSSPLNSPSPFNLS